MTTAVAKRASLDLIDSPMTVIPSSRHSQSDTARQVSDNTVIDNRPVMTSAVNFDIVETFAKPAVACGEIDQCLYGNLSLLRIH